MKETIDSVTPDDAIADALIFGYAGLILKQAHHFQESQQISLSTIAAECTVHECVPASARALAYLFTRHSSLFKRYFLLHSVNALKGTQHLCYSLDHLKHQLQTQPRSHPLVSYPAYQYPDSNQHMLFVVLDNNNHFHWGSPANSEVNDHHTQLSKIITSHNAPDIPTLITQVTSYEGGL